MKMRIELDGRIPETVRISAEWRIAFQLSRYSAEIDDVLIQIVADEHSGDAPFQCTAMVKLQSASTFTLHERSDQPGMAISTAIDRIASSVRRLVRRQSRISNNKGS